MELRMSMLHVRESDGPSPDQAPQACCAVSFPALAVTSCDMTLLSLAVWPERLVM